MSYIFVLYDAWHTLHKSVLNSFHMAIQGLLAGAGFATVTVPYTMTHFVSQPDSVTTLRSLEHPHCRSPAQVIPASET